MTIDGQSAYVVNTGNVMAPSLSGSVSILDVSNPTNVTTIDSTSNLGGIAMTLDGNSAYIGSISTDITIINVNSPSSPPLIIDDGQLSPLAITMTIPPPTPPSPPTPVSQSSMLIEAVNKYPSSYFLKKHNEFSCFL